jgi:hypothetical protein
MIIRKSDLTSHALSLGIWDSLLDMAGIPIKEVTANDVGHMEPDTEIEITSARKVVN